MPMHPEDSGLTSTYALLHPCHPLVMAGIITQKHLDEAVTLVLTHRGERTRYAAAVLSRPCWVGGRDYVTFRDLIVWEADASYMSLHADLAEAGAGGGWDPEAAPYAVYMSASCAEEHKPGRGARLWRRAMDRLTWPRTPLGDVPPIDPGPHACPERRRVAKLLRGYGIPAELRPEIARAHGHLSRIDPVRLTQALADAEWRAVGGQTATEDAPTMTTAGGYPALAA